MFELVEQSIGRRLQAMRDYPCLFRFIATAYYETDPKISRAMEIRKQASYQSGKEAILKRISRDPFQDPGDAEILLDMILYIAEGCMRGREDLQDRQIRDILPAFRHMLRSLRNHYYKRGYRTEEGD